MRSYTFYKTNDKPIIRPQRLNIYKDYLEAVTTFLPLELCEANDE
jgi:hypothetical protein